MNLIKKICELNEAETEMAMQAEEKVSEKHQMQSAKCNELYNQILSTLGEKQQKQLCKLDTEYFMLSGIWKDDGLEEGFEKGFKLAMRLIIDCLRD